MAFTHNLADSKERFSLLLLEPGEIYFEDFSVFYYPVGLPEHEAIKRKIRGRLKTCSKSIVFDPQNACHPMMKFPLRDCIKIEELNVSLLSKFDNHGNIIMIECKQIVEMKEDNMIAPYKYRKQPDKYLFSLNFGTCEAVVPQMCQLLRASTLTLADQASMIATIVQSRQARVSFDTSWLENLYEQIIMETLGDRITPLVTNPGRIMLTSSRLYFQPFNNVEPVPVMKVKLSDIKRLVKRRYLLRQVGLEIFCSEESIYSDMFLVFRNEVDREKLYVSILQQPDVNVQDSEPENITLKWQNGVISNFEYLMYLNSLADRSFMDLTQYPVFPWVITDFTSSELDLTKPETFRDLSKPVGALNEDRLKRLKERYADMPEPRFLYGSHYSTPGFVLFYLVRVAPEYMLCLQSGKFDQPDRMFHNLQETWQNVLTGATDFKELIPEFFQISESDFLVNKQALNLGVRQDGTKLNNIELPPWAKDSVDFCKKCRESLESDYVSQHLHHWIDLIFGYKQRGKEAEDANNLFYYLTYEGAVDLDSIRDPNERVALENQILEFGQTPRQLFASAHPARFACDTRKMIALPSDHIVLETEYDKGFHGVQATVDAASDGDGTLVDGFVMIGASNWIDMEQLTPCFDHKLHKDSVMCVKLSDGCKNIFSASQDTMLKIYSLEDQRQLRSVNLSNMALSSLSIMPDDKTILVGGWDNNVYLYSIDYGRAVDTIQAHDDAVSSIWWENNLLVTASWDSTIKVSCLCVSSDSAMILSGTKDGQVYLWDAHNHMMVSQKQVHTGVVNDVKFSPDGLRLLSCGEDQYMRIIDVHSGTEVYAKDAGEELRCLCWDGSTVLAGTQSGHLLIWDFAKVKVLNKVKGHDGAIMCIDCSSDGRTVLTGGQDRKVVMWKI
ncbi:protein FAN-like isoform X3 [Glandiceps talaboti]